MKKNIYITKRKIQKNKIFLIKYLFHYIINYVTYNFKNFIYIYILLQHFNKYLKFI